MSAAIVKKWWLESLPKGIKGDIFNSPALDHTTIHDKNPSGEALTFLGWDHGDEVPNLSGYGKVIMADIAFSADEMLNLSKKLAAKFIWIDHHESAINDSKGKYDGNFGLRDVNFAACELTWKYFMLTIKENPVLESGENKMPEIVRLLGRYDCFGHRGTAEERKVLEFQYGARVWITNYEEAYDALLINTIGTGLLNRKVDAILITGETIYQHLCTEARQTYAKAFSITFKITKPHSSVGFASHPYNFLCVNQERFNPINFGIDYHKDGYDGFASFWYKKGKWSCSLYNDDGKVDVSIIAKQFSGGGHKGAAGMVIDTKTMLKIIK